MTLAESFAKLFAGRVSSYGQYDETGPTKRVKTLQQPIPDDIYEKHLAGDGPYLGVIPIREDNTCYFGAIDLDEDGIDLGDLDAKVAAHSLPLVVCRSKSGGAHLYLFLSEPLSAKVVTDALKRFRAVLGHEKNPDGKAVEIFPKQVSLPVNATGNWINLPYYNHASTNRYAVIADRHLTLDEFIEYAMRKRVTARQLENWSDTDSTGGTFGDGPPCLATLHKQGFPEGTRNAGLLNVGIYLRAKYPDTWDTELAQFNHELEEPVDDAELNQIIRNLRRHDYLYTCDQHPIQPLCKKRACRKQKFGIEHFIKARRLNALPDLGKLVKVLSDPPRYRLMVNESEVSLSSEQLQQPLLFKRLMFEKLNLVVPSPKPHEWDEILGTLLATQIEEPAPVEAGERGLAVMFLRDFLLLRSKADGIEDVLRGMPWLDPTDKRVYFRATDFMGYLQRRQFRRFEMHELYSIFREDADLTFEVKQVKGAAAHLWSVPAPDNEQTEAFAFPAPTAQPIY